MSGRIFPGMDTMGKVIELVWQVGFTKDTRHRDKDCAYYGYARIHID
jgi:hypothetical protein